MAADGHAAQARWELENAVEDATGNDALFHYDKEQQAALQTSKPWRNDPRYFTNVRVSALALLKMAQHCKAGGSLEVMGLLEGKVVNRTFVVMDAFALPVEGTETRVNAQGDAME